MVGLRDASLRACALLLQAFGVSSADAVRLLAAQLELTAPSLVAATRAASWAKRLDPASSGALSAAIKSALHQSSEFILEWDRTECPCCGSASALRPHRSNRRRVAIVITQARVIEAATLVRGVWRCSSDTSSRKCTAQHSGDTDLPLLPLVAAAQALHCLRRAGWAGLLHVHIRGTAGWSSSPP
jgi:hypothetical protein